MARQGALQNRLRICVYPLSCECLRCAFCVDIRSQPYSRFNPDYSQKALQQHLKQHGIGPLVAARRHARAALLRYLQLSGCYLS
ncbi:MAG TPA: DUF488 family protein [Ktedonobacteraceae bacterium]|nr:DUF488 family protein [Ktedonobacteraceae bacterium]